MTASATEPTGARSGRAASYRSIVAILLINGAFIALWASGLAPRLAAEDGILETLQLLFAAGALCVFMFAALEDDGPIGTAGAAMAALAGLAMLREIDVRRLVVPDWMMIWAESAFRDTVIVVLLLLVVVYVWRHRDHFSAWLGMMLRWRAWPVWLGGICFASSVIVERGGFFASHIVLIFEEMAELNGFMLLLVAAWRHCHLLRASPPSS